MKQLRSLFFHPVLPCRTVHTSLISVNQTEPKPNFLLNCVKHTQSLSVRSVVSQREVHTVPLPVSDHEEPTQRSEVQSVVPSRSERKREIELQERLILLTEKLYKAGIQLVSDKTGPGQYVHLECSQCLEGGSKVKSLFLHIHSKGHSAVWKCFRTQCGWAGYVQAYASKVSTETRASKVNAEVVKQPRKITEEELKLEPLCNELLLFFKTRGISGETLRRNRVMQKPTKRGTAIAFLYRRGGTLVNCKYRQLPKIFWQEAGTEKILYGLDDIKNECDIIIVEGEIDKLSMEEAGFKNCVSVPSGAPLSTSKEVPAPQEDTRYQYLWNCMKYMKAASRIILATDADKPGQALAEELARRLGKERCWIVKWPMRTDDEVFKDANERLIRKETREKANAGEWRIVTRRKNNPTPTPSPPATTTTTTRPTAYKPYYSPPSYADMVRTKPPPSPRSITNTKQSITNSKQPITNPTQRAMGGYYISPHSAAQCWGQGHTGNLCKNGDLNQANSVSPTKFSNIRREPTFEEILQGQLAPIELPDDRPKKIVYFVERDDKYYEERAKLDKVVVMYNPSLEVDLSVDQVAEYTASSGLIKVTKISVGIMTRSRYVILLPMGVDSAKFIEAILAKVWEEGFHLARGVLLMMQLVLCRAIRVGGFEFLIDVIRKACSQGEVYNDDELPQPKKKFHVPAPRPTSSSSSKGSLLGSGDDHFIGSRKVLGQLCRHIEFELLPTGVQAVLQGARSMTAWSEDDHGSRGLHDLVIKNSREDAPVERKRLLLESMKQKRKMGEQAQMKEGKAKSFKVGIQPKTTLSKEGELVQIQVEFEHCSRIVETIGFQTSQVIRALNDDNAERALTDAEDTNSGIDHEDNTFMVEPHSEDDVGSDSE
ncbi:twinkle protein [Carex littledalei]|uniref:Twinkle protein n=1 Tax=Carex littledalei TaxID=544730 RepID=A0A833V1G7_9POAL|nr:twinkle protein [Carex littledalei]